MKVKNDKNNKIPDDFKKYFWDCNFEDLSKDKYLRIITERLLNYGDERSVKWLLEEVSLKKIREIVNNSRNLNSKTKNYWKLILNE